MDKFIRIECTVKATSEHHAASIFKLAGFRLSHVGGWSLLSDSLLPLSEHRDPTGASVSRAVKSNDYINITGMDLRPFGWMRVEYVVDLDEQDGGEITVLARPVEMPFDPKEQVDSTPALLRVVRRGLDVTASFISESNSFASLFDRLGVYAVQWRSLVYGLLSDLTPVGQSVVSEFAENESHFA